MDKKETARKSLGRIYKFEVCASPHDCVRITLEDNSVKDVETGNIAWVEEKNKRYPELTLVFYDDDSYCYEIVASATYIQAKKERLGIS